MATEEMLAGGKNVRGKAQGYTNAGLPVMHESRTSMRKVSRSRKGGCCGDKYAGPLPGEVDRQAATPDSPYWPGKHIVEQAGVLETEQRTLPILPEQPVANVSQKRQKGAKQGPIPSASEACGLSSHTIIPNPATIPDPTINHQRQYENQEQNERALNEPPPSRIGLQDRHMNYMQSSNYWDLSIWSREWGLARAKECREIEMGLQEAGEQLKEMGINLKEMQLMINFPKPVHQQCMEEQQGSSATRAGGSTLTVD